MSEQKSPSLPDQAALDALLGQSLLLTQDWSTEDLATVRSLARTLADLDRKGIRTPLCPNELAWAVFFDASTRTKSAWAGAASRLGMQPVIVDGSSTQVSHGETAAETGAMLGMNAHAMGIRHDLILGEGNSFIRDLKSGIDSYLDSTDDSRKVPIVNLQCDIDHPTQSMADLLWLEDNFEDLNQKNITVSWAYSPSYAKPLSVPQGLITLLTRTGANVTLAHPPGYQLMEDTMTAAAGNAEASGGSFRVTDNMDDAFTDAHVVYPKSWGPMTSCWNGLMPTPQETATRWRPSRNGRWTETLSTRTGSVMNGEWPSLTKARLSICTACPPTSETK